MFVQMDITETLKHLNENHVILHAQSVLEHLLRNAQNETAPHYIVYQEKPNAR